MRWAEILKENTLSSLVAADQRERQEYQDFVKNNANGDYTVGAKLYAKVKKRPLNDLFGEHERLKQFINTNFDFDSFSEIDWKNYWLLAQHCDFDRNFQREALKKIKKYLGTNTDEYRYLYDRLSCAMYGRQKFNTQNVCSVRN